MKQNEVPLLYLFVYKSLIEKFGRYNRVLSRKSILEIWRRCIHNVPRKYDFYILQEMCEFGLLEKINSKEFQLSGSKSDEKLTSNQKFGVIESLTPSEIKILKKLAPKHYRLIGKGAHKRLKKLDDFFLW
jgi:hypothetical protein